MRKNPVFLRWTLAVFVLTAVCLAPTMAQRTAKKPLTYDVYDSWRSIQGTQISRDGTWLAYALAAQDGDGELVVRNLKTDKEYRQARGQAPVITVDAKFVVFTIAPVKADVDKAKKEKKKPEEQPKNGLGILNLATGDVTTAERVKSFKVAEESAAFVAYLLEAPLPKEPEKKDEAKKEPEPKVAQKKEPATKEPAVKPAEKKEEPAKKPKEKKKEPGTDLIIRELATGKATTISEVVEYVWNKPGTWLAVAASSKKPEDDGAFVVNMKAADLARITLIKGLGHYKPATFDEKGTQLAFMSDRDDYKADVSPYKLYYWTEGTPAAVEAASGKTPGMPQGMAVSENGRLNFSKDGTKLFFGYAPVPAPEPDEDATLPVKVDIWNWKDSDLQPMQKVNADQDKKRNYMAVIHFLPKERKLVPLATPDMPTVALSEDSKVALGSSSLPYRQLTSWDQSYSDFYLVNLADGSQKKILEKFSNNVSISPGGQYLLYYGEQDRNWYSYRLLDGKTFNLTAKLGVNFFQETWDTPSDPSAYGNAGWTEGDKSVLIYDKYDIWEVKPDGSGGRNATNGFGRKNGLIFRHTRLDPEERTISLKEPLLLSTMDDATKGTGFYRVTLAAAAPAPAKPAPAAKKPAPAPAADLAAAGPDPVKVIMMNKSMGGLRKAKAADAYLFTIQTFSEFPNLWASGPTFWDMKKVSDANPQQSGFTWGQSELIHYMNADGVTLDAVLTKPDDFDPAKKYPLMVYIYERLADGLNRYQAPAPGTSINITRYVSNGYVVLQPDIIYETGYPGSSALKCVVPAVQKVVGLGFIDPKRIGIQGHSWGGYEITYMITQTDIFAAVEAGASVSNMTSAYGGIRWGSGMVREFQYEKTQSRIGATLFDRALQFIENSPIFWVERIKTPYLTIHNDEDDAVPWYQGIEFFTAMRRLGKEAYMFTFNTEKHGLRERDNQKYWTVHLDEFFDHFLLGKPAPEWMTKGVPYLERGKRDVASLYKK
jgi:dienelactone hydrolase